MEIESIVIIIYSLMLVFLLAFLRSEIKHLKKHYDEMLKCETDYSNDLYNDYMSYLKSREHKKELYKLIYINYQLVSELTKYTKETPKFNVKEFDDWFNSQIDEDFNND